MWVVVGYVDSRRGWFGSVRSLYGGVVSVCVWLGRKERGGGWEKGS